MLSFRPKRSLVSAVEQRGLQGTTISGRKASLSFSLFFSDWWRSGVRYNTRVLIQRPDSPSHYLSHALLSTFRNFLFLFYFTIPPQNSLRVAFLPSTVLFLPKAPVRGNSMALNSSPVDCPPVRRQPWQREPGANQLCLSGR